MAIGIDNVYQQVLAIANKEQRGYITPQEFNLFARKAQNDIFEKTFLEYKDAFLNPTSVLQSHKNLDMLREKMHPFRQINKDVYVDSSSRGTISRLGPELVTDNNFEVGTSWNAGNDWGVAGDGFAVKTYDASATYASTNLKATAIGNLNSSPNGKFFRVAFTLDNTSTGNDGLLKVYIAGNLIATVSSDGDYVFTGVGGSATDKFMFNADPDFGGRISNLEVRELTDANVGDVYWIESVYHFNDSTSMTFEEMDKKRVNFLQKYKAQTGFPLNIDHLIFEGTNGNLEFSQINTYYREDTSTLVFYPRPLDDSGNAITPKCDYVKTIGSMPDPKWAFTVVNGKALFDGNNYVDFHLHSSEEGNLVNKILELAGISLMKPDLQQSALQNQATNMKQPAPKTYQDNTDNERTTFVQDEFPYGRPMGGNMRRRR